MFVKNQTREESPLSGLEPLMGTQQWDALKSSKGNAFYELIFKHIPEENFKVLYSSKFSAPNSPVNCLIGAILLKNLHGWTDEELMNSVRFNLETRWSLGLRDLHSVPFCERTWYNFNRRLSEHKESSKEDLLADMFKFFTAKQLKQLQVKGDVKRLDSILLNSNLQSYSRLSLCVEVLERFHRVMTPSDQSKYEGLLSPYLKGGEKYVYTIKNACSGEHLLQAGAVYHRLCGELQSAYAGQPAFDNLLRVCNDHFLITDKDEQTVVELKKSDSGCLQSPDDVEAAFHTKRKETHQGYSAVIAETCSKDNPVNLVTDIVVQPNNVSDSAILEQLLPDMLKTRDVFNPETPELKELHFDGGFGSEKIDELGKDIVLIQTAIKGPQAEAPLRITQDNTDGKISYTVTCANEEHPPVKAIEVNDNFKACFELDRCKTCPFFEVCPTKSERNEKKGTATYRFSEKNLLRQNRHDAIQKIPPERRVLRAGIEPTVRMWRRGENHKGKLRIRGRMKFELYALSMGIVVNFERIFRYLKAENLSFLVKTLFLILKSVLCQRTCLIYQNVLINN